MLNLNELVCRRDGRALFEPVSLTAQAGQCIELLGPNGAGKTTLLRTLAGVHSQFDGSYLLDAFLFQGHRVGLDELLSPLENLSWFGALEGRMVAPAEARAALVEVGMQEHALRPVRELSQGQQRRVAMARWQLSRATVWLLDEPYTSLDVAGQALLNRMLARHCEGGGVVFCATHTPLTVSGRGSVMLAPVAAAA